MPSQLWNTLSIEELPFNVRNTEAVGSGPYQISEVVRNKQGSITRITLRAYNGNGYTPNIEKIAFEFFENSAAVLEALEAGKIDATAALTNTELASLRDQDDFTLNTYPLPRTFGLFPNQNRSIALRDEAVRRALAVAIDRDALINTILQGFGNAEYSPVPAAFFEQTPPTELTAEERQAEARNILETGGWTQNATETWTKTIDGDEVSLTFTIATVNNELFAQTAATLKEQLGAIGITIDIAQYEQADFLQSVLRTRDYELLLTGNDLGRGLDLYQFWHSSQRENQLNAALYTNLDADVFLTRYRSATGETERDEQLAGFLAEFQNDMPAIFLMSPDTVYVVKRGITVTPVTNLSRPHERLSTVEDWHMTTEQLWPFMQ
jgi:peptide/nickel transport system substrate-binding protein